VFRGGIHKSLGKLRKDEDTAWVFPDCGHCFQFPSVLWRYWLADCDRSTSDP